MSAPEDGSKKIITLAAKLLESDPNRAEPIEYRIAAMRVAISTLEADQGRQVQLALLAKAFR